MKEKGYEEENFVHKMHTNQQITQDKKKHHFESWSTIGPLKLNIS